MYIEDADEDFKKLIKAVIEYSVTSYIKLQHPSNRKTKSQKQDFSITLDLFYNPEYTFQHFIDPETQNTMSTLDMLTVLLDGVIPSMENTHNYIVSESIDYWWNKNFHDITVPDTVSIAGKVYKVVNSPNNFYVDHQNLRIYVSKKAKFSDRHFFALTLRVLLKETNIELTEEQFDNFHKFFYLLLKVNNGFN
jgi:hypothetical protein